MDTTVETIIKKIENNYTKIQELYQDVPVTALVEPALPNGWSVKDTLGHIAAWIWRFTIMLEAARDTNNPLDARPDVTGLNRSFYEERRTWHWVVVEADFRHAHGALLGVIRRLPPERLADHVVQEAIARETWEHYAEHLPELERWHRQFISNRLPVLTSELPIPQLFAREQF